MQKHLDLLKTFPFVVEFTANNFGSHLSILAGFCAKVVEHLFRPDIITLLLLNIHKLLTTL